MSVRVLTTPDADEQVLEIMEWWREKRQDSPYLFDDELAAAIDLLGEQPEAGKLFPRRGMPQLRRLLLKNSEYHVYYVYTAAEGELLIHGVWGAVRGRRPRLRR